MTQVIQYPNTRTSLSSVYLYNISSRVTTAAAAELTDDEIREWHLKHIAEITKDLAPPKFADLTEDQQDFLDRKGRYAPYRPAALHRVEGEEEDEEYW